MKQLTFIFILLASINSFSQEIEKKWYFESITEENDSVPLRDIGKNDFLNINNDGSFDYFIASVNLKAEGTWQLINQTLRLSYSIPKDTIRFYQFNLSKQGLVLKENGINYTFVAKKTAKTNGFQFTNILKGVLAIMVLIAIAVLFSRDRKSINWHLVWRGLLIQIVFAVAILKIPFVQKIFDWLSSVFVTILNFTQDGSIFLFGGLIENTTSFGYIFAFQVLPTIIFFSALTSVLFYYGVLQKVVYYVALLMKKTLSLSGSESLAAIGNIFLGQTESPLLIKPYIEKMTLSELLCLMSGGMATIAGGVLAAYIGFLGGNDPQQQLFFAKHLLAASVMSAPAAVVAAKLLLPETKETNQDMTISDEQIGSNVLEAISIGTTQGIKLAVNVGAMLLVFIAFISMINYFFGEFIGANTGLNSWVKNITNGTYDELSLEFILGYTLAPLTWIMGVCKQDMVLVGQLLGQKTILNEFVAYVSLGELKSAGKFFEKRSIIIATYILCGFANFSSIGIQIGGISAIAPSRTKDLSKLGMLALLAGTLACLFTAVVVGMIL
ncbi:MAG: nucleoside transporter C-terminal domain-containing protein [Bacteroidota bacterium]|nr:nucleoside transporter C-terminal domain-containing protein [Bacteroidota bacterium]